MEGLQIVRHGQGDIIDVPRPEPYPDEVVVEVEVCNSCTHWDLTAWDGVDPFGRPGHPRYPLAAGFPGHELAGIVVEAGEQVASVHVGDCVALWGSPPGVRPLRNEGRLMGGYLKYFVTHERSVLPFPDQRLSWREMAMLETLSCVGQGVVVAGDLTGQRVAVSDMGAAGLMMLQALKSHGPDTLTAIDFDSRRLELSLQLGARMRDELGLPTSLLPHTGTPVEKPDRDRTRGRVARSAGVWFWARHGPDCAGGRRHRGGGRQVPAASDPRARQGLRRYAGRERHNRLCHDISGAG